jgi:hypothetical protein
VRGSGFFFHKLNSWWVNKGAGAGRRPAKVHRGQGPSLSCGTNGAVKRRSSTELHRAVIRGRVCEGGGKQQVPRLRNSIRCADAIAPLGMTRSLETTESLGMTRSLEARESLGMTESILAGGTIEVSFFATQVTFAGDKSFFGSIHFCYR